MTIFDHLAPLSANGDDESNLRVALLNAQRQLADAERAAIIIISGVNAGGKSDVIRTLNEWLDPRLVHTQAFGKKTDEEALRPSFWRYWMALPARGRIAIYVGSWYSDVLNARLKRKFNRRSFENRLGHINQLESDLIDDGTMVFKYWLHLSKAAQKERFDRLLADNTTAWQVTKQDWKDHETHENFVTVAEHAVTTTDVARAPWQLLNAQNIEACAHFVGRDVAARITHQLEMGLGESFSSPTHPSDPSAAAYRAGDNLHKDILQTVALDKTVTKKRYQKRLTKLQGKLSELQRRAIKQGVSSVIVFEGWDAAGKGGAIRRITYALDPREYRVIRIAAPSDEELAHHYLWRFWRHVPRAGNVTIYDRSWYGRVLVERVEGITPEHRWRAAYDEINDFEQTLHEHGTLVNKFWLQISPEEQMRRFQEREQIPYKQYKITNEDYRNREKWPEYLSAANEMIARTDTAWAPWHLIPANDKRCARIAVLEGLTASLENKLSD